MTIFFVVGSAATMLYLRLGAVHSCTYAFDSCFSNATRDRLKEFIDTRNHTIGSSKQLFEDLKKQFPQVKSLIVERCAPGVMHYDIQSVRPLVTINKQCVVAENGAVFPMTLFAQRSVNFLYDVAVPNFGFKQLPTSFVTAMQEMLPEMFSSYAVSWIDDKEMWLRDKNDPSFFIICNTKKLPDAQMFSHCNRLRQEMTQKTDERKTEKQSIVVADIRFDKQIIFSGDKKGGVYG